MKQNNDLSKYPKEKHIEISRKGGLKSAEIRRKKREMKEILDAMLSCTVPKIKKAQKESFENMGVNGEDVTYMAELCLQMYKDATSQENDPRARLKAIELIHKIIDGNKIDITSGGEKIAHEPITIEVIDSRSKVAAPVVDMENEG